MGKLVTETPYSEITATLELFDRFGLEREDLTGFRKAASHVQMEVVRLMKCGAQKSSPKAVIEVVNGVTHIIISSDGRCDEDFISFWERQYRPSDYTKDITRRAKFTPTTGVTYRIPIVMGSEFSDNERITRNIRKEGARRNYHTLPFEAACLLREAVSDEDLEHLGLWWLIGMHDQVEAFGRSTVFLGVHRHDGGRGVRAYDDHPIHGWDREVGFAFLAPQDQS